MNLSISSTMLLIHIVPFFLVMAMCSSCSCSLSSSSSSSSSSSLSPSAKRALAQIPSLAMKTILLGRSSSSSSNKNKNRNPMRPVVPQAIGSLDYLTPVVNLFNNIKNLEHNLKKQTYGYVLTVAGRPIDELTMSQKFVKAALMPGRYYQDASSSIAEQFNNIIKSGDSKSSSKNRNRHLSSKSKTGKQIPWANVLLQLINLAAAALPTPVIKS